ncbi:MAG: hypothetical protein KC547_06650 [Anaerolineae bacterium]|nr:hypothetical protein [Anaerolineae bacterium]
MITLTINGTLHELTPVKAFRAQYDLPPTFGTAYFAPKDYAGLGSIDGAAAGAALGQLRAALLSRIPAKIVAAELPSVVTRLTDHFREQMEHINTIIGLRAQEVEFAVSGFADAAHKYAFSLLRARLTGEQVPDFKLVYDEWLMSGVRVLETPFAYDDDSHHWHVRVISHVYGRMGLIVQAGEATHYVYDPALACPAEGFMAGLLGEVCAHLVTALGQ